MKETLCLNKQWLCREWCGGTTKSIFTQVYIYEYLPSNTQFPMEKWIIADYPIAQARTAYQIVAAFLAEQFSDPDDKGTPGLTERDVEAARQTVSRGLERKPDL